MGCAPIFHKTNIVSINIILTPARVLGSQDESICTSKNRSLNYLCVLNRCTPASNHTEYVYTSVSIRVSWWSSVANATKPGTTTDSEETACLAVST